MRASHVARTSLVVVVASVALAAPAASGPDPRSDPQEGTATTTVTVDLRHRLHPVAAGLLGVNHHYLRNGAGLWDPLEDRPYPQVVAAMRRAGVSVVRFPGGTLANLYDWTRAIGPERGCQTDGRRVPGDGYVAVRRGLAYGPDEFMELLDQVGAAPLMMVPYVTETPSHAANLVEYMNSPAGDPGNPNGGVDWAEVRAANGHPAPYGVHWWEVGNEQYHSGSRYWLSPRDRQAMRQYAFGGRASLSGEALGRGCDHPLAGVRSDGSPGQTFEVLFPPVRPGSVQVRVAGHEWHAVADLAAVGRERAFELDPATGTVRFGDGAHGRIPGRGARVRASYVSVHRGYFSFAEAMRAVDPSIRVCSTWGTARFVDVVGERRLDCLSSHAITKFRDRLGMGPDHWAGPLQGHDLLMLATDDRETGVRTTRASLPAGVPLLLTESSAIDGDADAFPGWSVSASHAVHMASLWVSWLRIGVRITTSDELMYAPLRGVVGQGPHFTFTAQAVTRQALSPMVRDGGRVLAASVQGNPVRRALGVPGSYPGLAVTATRTPEGVVYLLVVNRLPDRPVTARILLTGRATTGHARVRTVSGRSFASWNHPGARPAVRLRVTRIPVAPHGFEHRFPPASTTLVRLPLRPPGA